MTRVKPNFGNNLYPLFGSQGTAMMFANDGIWQEDGNIFQSKPVIIASWSLMATIGRGVDPWKGRHPVLSLIKTIPRKYKFI
eukprot:jgi/Botrbrau1/12785/Bobra.117_1s0004.1